MCRRLFQRVCVDVGDERVRTIDAIRFLREPWEKLETKVIEAGWGIYENELGLASEDNGDDSDWQEEYEEQTK
jgi:hypothetical protein